MDIQGTILIIILISIVIDLSIGELPSRIHPVVWMGKLIDVITRLLIDYRNKISGIVLTLIVVIIFTLATYVLTSLSANNNILYILVSSIILSTMFAIKVLFNSAFSIKKDLEKDIDIARKNLSYLVSRNTENLNNEEIISATIETLTENLTDSVIAPLFYALIFGVIGAVAYRAINTLDAMVGYKKPETLKIGWFPAKTDDVLNYLPARITGILVVISALILHMDWRNAYKIMIRDSRNPESPNSGYSMAAAAGALEVKLEKRDHYEIGDNLKPLNMEKITDAIKITKVTIIIFLTFSFIIYGLILIFIQLI